MLPLKAELWDKVSDWNSLLEVIASLPTGSQERENLVALAQSLHTMGLLLPFQSLTTLVPNPDVTRFYLLAGQHRFVLLLYLLKIDYLPEATQKELGWVNVDGSFDDLCDSVFPVEKFVCAWTEAEIIARRDFHLEHSQLTLANISAHSKLHGTREQCYAIAQALNKLHRTIGNADYPSEKPIHETGLAYLQPPLWELFFPLRCSLQALLPFLGVRDLSSGGGGGGDHDPSNRSFPPLDTLTIFMLMSSHIGGLPDILSPSWAPAFASLLEGSSKFHLFVRGLFGQQDKLSTSSIFVKGLPFFYHGFRKAMAQFISLDKALRFLYHVTFSSSLSPLMQTPGDSSKKSAGKVSTVGSKHLLPMLLVSGYLLNTALYWNDQWQPTFLQTVSVVWSKMVHAHVTKTLIDLSTNNVLVNRSRESLQLPDDVLNFAHASAPYVQHMLFFNCSRKLVLHMNGLMKNWCKGDAKPCLEKYVEDLFVYSLAASSSGTEGTFPTKQGKKKKKKKQEEHKLPVPTGVGVVDCGFVPLYVEFAQDRLWAHVGQYPQEFDGRTSVAVPGLQGIQYSVCAADKLERANQEMDMSKTPKGKVASPANVEPKKREERLAARNARNGGDGTTAAIDLSASSKGQKRDAGTASLNLPSPRGPPPPMQVLPLQPDMGSSLALVPGSGILCLDPSSLSAEGTQGAGSILPDEALDISVRSLLQGIVDMCNVPNSNVAQTFVLSCGTNGNTLVSARLYPLSHAAVQQLHLPPLSSASAASAVAAGGDVALLFRGDDDNLELDPLEDGLPDLDDENDGDGEEKPGKKKRPRPEEKEEEEEEEEEDEEEDQEEQHEEDSKKKGVKQGRRRRRSRRSRRPTTKKDRGK